MSASILTKDTLIPVGAVLIVLSAAFSYGIMYQKVATLTDEVAELNVAVQQLSKDVNQLIGSKTLTYGE